MPYLNWKTAPVHQDVTHLDARSPGQKEFLLELAMNRDSLNELLSMLEDVFLQGGPEFRLDLPREWIVFWKNRDGESRLLIAHPQPEEWVTTIALEKEHASRLLERLRGLQSGQSVELSALGPVGPVSNVEVKITLQ